MDYRDEYRRKLISAGEAAGLVKSGMSIDYGYSHGFPQLIDKELAKRVKELERVKIRAYRPQAEPQVPKVDPEQEHFIYHSWHISATERKYHDQGCCSYIPSNLSEIPGMYRERLKDEVDIAFVEVTPMDENGYFNFGASIGYQKALCEVARTLVVEVNESQPWIDGGYDEVVHISQVDYVVENNEYEIVEVPAAPVTKADEAIAEYVAELIEDESTIELGIGSIPNTVGNLLIKHGLRDLGIHSGQFSDSMMDLIEAGVVTCRKQTPSPGRAVVTSVFGSRRLYDYANHNPMIAGFPCDYTHNIHIVAQNTKQVCINNAIRIDLTGQVCSESIGHRQISGTGGQLDWTRGANMSPGGKAFICLYSTYGDRDGRLRSNIVSDLQLGDVVSVPRTDVSYVVTEFGVVNLRAKSLWQRAKLLISIAHPDFKAELEEAAQKTNLITRGTASLTSEGS